MTEQKYGYRYPRPNVTVDLIIWRSRARSDEVLLIRRRDPPYAGSWALPGGFIEPRERLAAAARRELREETGLSVSDLQQFATFGEPGRDPRGWSISVVFWGKITDAAPIQAGDDAAEVRWWPIKELPVLAFDHQKILTQFQELLQYKSPPLASGGLR